MDSQKPETWRESSWVKAGSKAAEKGQGGQGWNRLKMRRSPVMLSKGNFSGMQRVEAILSESEWSGVEGKKEPGNHATGGRSNPKRAILPLC